jgi:sirohydrochlorin ferrochelatase
MDAATLLIPAAFAFLAGILFLGYLVVHPLRMASYLLFTSVMVFASSVAVTLGFWGDWTGGAVASGTSIASFMAGYVVMSMRVLSADEKRILPPIRRHKGDPGLGHTAVVYFTHGESPTYTPINWIRQFREFDEQDIPFMPWLLRPLFLYNLRKRYLRVGKSDHYMMHALRLREIEQEYRRRGDETTKFYLSFLDYPPRPDEAVVHALNEGASKIVLTEVFVTQSNHTLEGEEMVEALHPEEYGARVSFTKPLWDSALMHRMFVERADAVLGETTREKVGVLLVGHGQPDEWDVEFPSETQQETVFREGIKRAFVDAGYKAENVTSAWMEFKEPKPSKKIGELVANGVERILVFSASISAEAIHSQCDVPDLVRRAKVPEDIFIINMGAWDNNPLVIRAIMERIDEVARKD